jgi:hypothetical protein
VVGWQSARAARAPGRSGPALITEEEGVRWVLLARWLITGPARRTARRGGGLRSSPLAGPRWCRLWRWRGVWAEGGLDDLHARGHAVPLVIVEAGVDAARRGQGDAGAGGELRVLGVALVGFEGRSAGVAKQRGGLRFTECSKINIYSDLLFYVANMCATWCPGRGRRRIRGILGGYTPDQGLRGQDCWTPASAAATSPCTTARLTPTHSRDLAQGLAFGAAGQDRAPLVGVDHSGSAASRCGLRTGSLVADDLAMAVLGQGERHVEHEGAFNVLARSLRG